ncbi:MAG TPA: hypothetical protein DCQ20_08930, partial [Nitrospira sp.]|nr:hypothetical protein [Nitrospira sp.]
MPTLGQVSTGSWSFQTLPLRGYNLIYNQWFRDENLVNSAVVRKTDAGDVYGDWVLRRRGKRHDYFTGCLPWPQKGGSAVSIPLGMSAPVLSSGANISLRGVTGAMTGLFNTGVAGSSVTIGGPTTAGALNWGASG